MLEIPEGVWSQGDNRLEIDVQPTGGGYDVVYVDSVVIDYRQRLAPVGGNITLSSQTGTCLQAEGLSESDPILLDVTDPGRPVRLVGFGVFARNDGTFSIRFRDDGPPTAPVLRRYMLFERSAFQATPEYLGPRRSLDLPPSSLQVDYLVITHPAFQAEAERLARFHSGRGLQTWVTSTDAIYDHFGNGRPSPQAIRDFFQGVSSTFVLLLGGSTVDSNGHLPGSPPDFLPAPFWVRRASNHEGAADGWYVMDGQGSQPIAAIGRLPVSTARQAEAVVDKIIAATQALEDPTNRVLFVADDYDPFGSGPTHQFELAAESLIRACVPDRLTPDRLYKAYSADPPSDLRARAEEGIDAVVYLGHAYLSGWSSYPVLVNSDQAAAYANAQPFLLFSWTCFDGAFVGPWAESLGWAFVRNPDGGASLATASSSLSDPRALRLLAEQTMCLLMSGKASTVGEALLEAKQNLGGTGAILDDLLATYNLLGDPAMPNPWRMP
jgi:hypothetical protein